MSKNRLSGLAYRTFWLRTLLISISIEREEMASNVDFEHVIYTFAKRKNRRKLL